MEYDTEELIDASSDLATLPSGAVGLATEGRRRACGALPRLPSPVRYELY